MAKRKTASESTVVVKESPRRDWRYWVRLITGDSMSGLVKLLLAFLVLQWLLVQQFSIPSGSMEPTLHGDPRFLRGDRVLVNKWAFGPRIPFSNQRIVDLKDPKRWDIVVFHAVQENAEHGVLIKRVVGLPGEHVQIGTDGRIVINGVPVDPPEELRDVLHYTTSLMPQESDVKRYLVKLAAQELQPQLRVLPEPVRHDVATIRSRLGSIGRGEPSETEIDALVAGLDPITMEVARSQLTMQYRTQLSREKPFRYGIVDTPEYSVVPAKHYFVLGDNSGNSVDGRFFGWLPKDRILGYATSIWWPFTRARDFTGWTDTWWGKGIIYGIPALWIGYEVCVAFLFCSWRVRRTWIDELEVGDHVLVNRIALGMRIPFTSRRLPTARVPQSGDLVLARTPERCLDGYVVARVGREHGKGKQEPGLLLEMHENGKNTCRVPIEHVVGTVGSVWWPLSRRRKLAAVPAPTEE